MLILRFDKAALFELVDALKASESDLGEDVFLGLSRASRAPELVTRADQLDLESFSLTQLRALGKALGVRGRSKWRAEDKEDVSLTLEELLGEVL